MAMLEPNDNLVFGGKKYTYMGMVDGLYILAPEGGGLDLYYLDPKSNKVQSFSLSGMGMDLKFKINGKEYSLNDIKRERIEAPNGTTATVSNGDKSVISHTGDPLPEPVIDEKNTVGVYQDGKGTKYGIYQDSQGKLYYKKDGEYLPLTSNNLKYDDRKKQWVTKINGVDIVVPAALVTTGAGIGATFFHLTTDFINDPSSGYHRYSPDGGTIYFGAGAHNIDAAAADGPVYTKYATVKTMGTNNPIELDVYKSNKDDKYYVLVDGEYKECEYVNGIDGGTYKYGDNYFQVNDMLLVEPGIPGDYKPYCKGLTDDEIIYYNEKDGKYYVINWNGKEYEYTELMPTIAHLPEGPDGTPAQDVITHFNYPDGRVKNVHVSDLIDNSSNSNVGGDNHPAVGGINYDTDSRFSKVVKEINYDFAFSTDKIDKLSIDLNERCSNVSDKIAAIYRIIDSMGLKGDKDWYGQVYDSFNSTCYQYKKFFDAYVEMLNDYIKFLGTIKEKADGFSSDVKNRMNNLQ